MDYRLQFIIIKFTILIEHEKTLRVRSTSSERYVNLVEEWLTKIFKKVHRFQYSYRGPVIAFQVENEYGNYNEDPKYLSWLKNIYLKVFDNITTKKQDDIIFQNFVKELLFTCDGAGALQKNSTFYLEGELKAANFQIPNKTLDILADLQPEKPLLGTNILLSFII